MSAKDFAASERRYLRRFECGWCEQRLDRDSCGAIYERCDPEQRDQRRRDCLSARTTRTKQDTAAQELK